MFNKKYKIFAAALAIISIFSFCSCGSEIDTYTSSNGINYKIVRDSNGNFITDSSGDICVYITNENGKLKLTDSGEYMTGYIPFDGRLTDGRKIETSDFSFTLPSGFSASDDNNYYDYDKGQGQIFIFYDETYNMDDVVNARLDEFKNLQSEYGSENVKYSKKIISGKNISITSLDLKSDASEYNRNVFDYYFPYGKGYYRINCVESNSLGINFDSFAKSIRIKIKQ